MKNKTTKQRKIIFLITILGMLFLSYTILNVYNIYETNKENYIYISPVEELTEQELIDSKLIIEQRINREIYPFVYLFIENDRIVINPTEELKENKEIIERNIKPLLFEAKVGNDIVFKSGKDIEGVCIFPHCSGIDMSVGCTQIDENKFNCPYLFTMKISEEASKRLLEAIKNLEVIKENGNEYLEEKLIFLLDGELINELIIKPELKDEIITDIRISGYGIGETKELAEINTINNMRELQNILTTKPIPYQFEITN